MDAYLNALEKHEPALVPVAAHYRYTENGAEIPLGEALWNRLAGRYQGGIAPYRRVSVCTRRHLLV
jgi:hypothetical protein